MNESRLRDWLEIVGILAVVASLVFVGIEIRHSSRAALEESFGNEFSAIVPVEELVIEYPEFEPEPVDNAFRCGLN